MQLHSALKQFYILINLECNFAEEYDNSGIPKFPQVDALHTCTCELPRAAFQWAEKSHKKKKIFSHEKRDV